MSAIKFEWLRIKYGKAFHARIGVRRTFACGKRYTKGFKLTETAPYNKRCKSCKGIINFLEDMYGGAGD